METTTLSRDESLETSTPTMENSNGKNIDNDTATGIR